MPNLYSFGTLGFAPSTGALQLRVGVVEGRGWRQRIRRDVIERQAHDGRMKVRGARHALCQQRRSGWYMFLRCALGQLDVGGERRWNADHGALGTDQCVCAVHDELVDAPESKGGIGGQNMRSDAAHACTVLIGEQGKAREQGKASRGIDRYDARERDEQDPQTRARCDGDGLAPLVVEDGPPHTWQCKSEEPGCDESGGHAL